MLRQPVPLISVGLRYKPLSVFPSAPLMWRLASARSWTAAVIGSAVKRAAAGVRIAKTPLLVMSLLASPFACSSETTAVNRVTFTSFDQVTGLLLQLAGRCNTKPSEACRIQIAFTTTFWLHTGKRTETALRQSWWAINY